MFFKLRFARKIASKATLFNGLNMPQVIGSLNGIIEWQGDYFIGEKISYCIFLDLYPSRNVEFEMQNIDYMVNRDETTV